MQIKATRNGLAHGRRVQTFKIMLDDGEQINSTAGTQSEDITSALLATMHTAAVVAIDEIGARSEVRSLDVHIEDPTTGETATAKIIVATTVGFAARRRQQRA
jgi:hypothetical protein